MKSGVMDPEPHFHRDEEWLQIESEVEIAIEMDDSDCNAQNPMPNATLFG